jgi:hypothetical protein
LERTNFPLPGKWSVFICVAVFDGGVPGVVGLLRFLRKRAGTPPSLSIPKGRLMVLVTGLRVKKKA